MDDAALSLFDVTASHPWSTTVRASIVNALQTTLQAHNSQKLHIRSIYTDLDSSRRDLVQYYDCKSMLADLQAKFDVWVNKQPERVSPDSSKDQLIATLKVELDKLRALLSASSTNAERFQSLFESEAKITSVFSDMHRLLSYPRNSGADQIATDIENIRKQASERGDRIASLMAEQTAAQELISDLRRQLSTTKPNSSARKEDEISQLQRIIDEQNQRLEQAAEYVKYQEDVILSLQAGNKTPTNGNNSDIVELKGIIATYETKLQQAADFIKYQQEQLVAAEKHYNANPVSPNEDSNNDLKEAKALVASYEIKLQQAAEYVNYLQEQQTACEEELASLKSQLQSQESSQETVTKEYESKLDEQRAVVTGLQSQVKSMDEELKRYRDLEQTHKTEVTQLSDRLREKTNEISSLQQEVEKGKQEVDRLSRLHSEQRDDLKRNHEQQVKDLQAKLSQLQGLTDRLQASEEELTSLKAVNHAYEDKLKKAADYVQYLQSQYKELEEELMLNRASSATPSDNSAELKALVAEYESKLQQGADYVSYLQQQLNLAEEKLLALPSEEDNKVKTSSSLEVEIASLRKEYERLQGQLHETEQLNAKYETKLKQAADYVNYLQEMQAELQEQVQQLQIAQSESKAAPITGGPGLPASKQHDYEHQLQVNQSLRRQIDEMITRQEEMLRGIRDNEKKIADQQAVIAEQEQLIADLEAQQQAGIGIGKSKEEEVQSLRRQIIELKAAQAEALQDHEYIVKELVDMKVSYAQVREQFDTDKKTIARLKERIQALQGPSDKRVASAPSQTPPKKK